MTLTLSPIAWRPRMATALLALVAAVATSIILLAGTSPSSSLPVAASSPAPAVPTLADVAATDPGRSVEVIVRFASPAAFAQGRAAVVAAGGRVTRDLHVINGYGARLTAAQAQALALDPSVVGVSLNRTVETSSSTAAVQTSHLESAGISKLWDGRRSGATGKGVTVAVLDTGIAGGHPDFRTSETDGGSRVVNSAVMHPDATTEDDRFGHGTHVAGLIAGDGRNRPEGDPLRGRYVGAAPDAELVSVKVSDDEGNASVIDVIYGLQFVVDHKDELGIRIVNLSLSSASSESPRTDPLNAAVESAWLHGIVVVAAAGNKGTAGDAVHHAPGNDPYVISVGAIDTHGTKQTADDTLAPWSSRGVTQDGTAKPEIAAPGTRVVAPYAPGSKFGELCRTCVVDGEYFRVGGTSMSAAIVSGIAATLLEEHPEWTPNQVKGALMNGLRPTRDGKLAVDADKAMKAKGKDLVTNAGLTPNDLIDTATGDIDYTRASWSRASWSRVEGDRASWSRASWSRASWSRASWSCDCAVAVTGEADPNRASWSRASWSRASWSRASWSRASWSRASWSRASWSASFDK